MRTNACASSSAGLGLPVGSPVGLCVDCERPVRGACVCSCCLALLHPLCARGSGGGSGSVDTSTSTCSSCSSLIGCEPSARQDASTEPCFEAPYSSESEGHSDDDLSTCDTVLDAVLEDWVEKDASMATLENLTLECNSLRRVAAFLDRHLHEARCRVEELETSNREVCRRASWPPGPRDAQHHREVSARAPMPAPSVSILVTDFDERPSARRLELVADANGVDLTVEVRRRLQDMAVIVAGTVRPGAGLPPLLQDVERCLCSLRPGDAVVLIAGASQDPLASWTDSLLEMVLRHKEAAFMLLLVEIPLRPGPGGPAPSAVQDYNNDIRVLSRNATSKGDSALRVVSVPFQNCLRSAQFKPIGRSFLNKSGKTKLAKVISQAIRNEWSRAAD